MSEAYHWVNDDPDVYYETSESVRETKSAKLVKRSFFSHFDLSGYQVVRGQYLTARSELPGISMFDNKIIFNSSCGKRLRDFSYIQLLLHPTERKIAIRPCKQNDVFSIYWNVRKNSLNKTIVCPYFGKALFRIMEWDPEFHYRVFGLWIEKGDDRIMIFNLSDALPLVSYKENKSGRKKETIICHEGRGDAFGEALYLFKLTDFELFINSGTRKQRSWLPEDWRKCFGVPFERHDDLYKINLAEGYITTNKMGGLQ